MPKILEFKKREKEELIWACLNPILDPDGVTRQCGHTLFHIHIDATIECGNCGFKNRTWMESIDG